MESLEQALTDCGIRWDPQVVNRGRVEILRRFRRYLAEWPVEGALRLAYLDVEAGEPPEELAEIGCSLGGSGCSGCPSADC